MAAFSYRTIDKPGQAVYKEKGSRFLAFAFPIENEQQIRHHLQALRKEFFDARHHCYAWMLGAEGTHYRANDDGEPNHSAGDPILGKIRSHQLTNILIVVVRYFGGVKLGVGGLISAYKTGAEMAIAQCSIVEKEVTESVMLHYDYRDSAVMMKLIADFSLVVTGQDFTDTPCLTVSVNLRQKSAVFEKISLLQKLGSSIRLA